MYPLIGIIIVLLVLLGLGSLYSVFKTKIHFFVTGLDESFSVSDLVLLWNVAQICQLEEPTSLFYSMPSLTKCMAQISNQTEAAGTAGSQKNQLLMSKLFQYRTKIQNESDDKKGLMTTMALDKGQKIRILLPGKGVFYSEIVNNGNKIVISVPKQKNMIPFTADEWVNKVISVYLWRKGDARYVFDTTVEQSGLFLGKSSLFLKHSNNLIRTQKRKAVRAKCEIHGQLFIVKSKTTDYTAVETQNGYRCLIEDISEAGALIKIGGKGAENVQIKLQFTIESMLIVMFGVIRRVEFNEADNQSLLHFECTHIETPMKNEVLRFVYDMLPEKEKEVLEAINQTDSDIEEENSEELAAEGIVTDNQQNVMSENATAALNSFENQPAGQVSDSTPSAEDSISEEFEEPEPLNQNYMNS